MDTPLRLMHETLIAQNIIKEAEKHGAVKGIYLEIGELAHVPPHELIECLEKLVPWKIGYREIPAKAVCACGFRGHPNVLERGHDSFLIECPGCHGMPALVEGQEIIIKKVSVE